jgi:calmodulin
MEVYNNQLTQDQIEEFKEAFSLFTKDGLNTIEVKHLGLLLRSVGQNVTGTELIDMMTKFDIALDSTIDLSNFLSLMKHVVSESDNEEVLREAFRAFDNEGKGFIPEATLRHVMTNLGDKLPETEVDEMMKDANIDPDGEINYEEFVTAISSM